jgi:hypothetical protein
LATHFSQSSNVIYRVHLIRSSPWLDTYEDQNYSHVRKATGKKISFIRLKRSFTLPAFKILITVYKSRIVGLYARPI